MRSDPLHERVRELLSLRLYGELEVDEAGELAAHLAACAECRAFASQLDRGLGRLVAAPVADDFPGGWDERLRQATSSAPQRRTGPRWFGLGAAAGLAAGLAVAWGSIALRPTEWTPRATSAASNGAAGSFATALETAGAPPRARDGGEIACLREYLRR